MIAFIFYISYMSVKILFLKKLVVDIFFILIKF